MLARPRVTSPRRQNGNPFQRAASSPRHSGRASTRNRVGDSENSRTRSSGRGVVARNVGRATRLRPVHRQRPFPQARPRARLRSGRGSFDEPAPDRGVDTLVKSPSQRRVDSRNAARLLAHECRHQSEPPSSFRVRPSSMRRLPGSLKSIVTHGGRRAPGRSR